MKYSVRPAQTADLQRMEEIYANARAFRQPTEIQINGEPPTRQRRC